jgi:hypothetical protein
MHSSKHDSVGRDKILRNIFWNTKTTASTVLVENKTQERQNGVVKDE